MDLEEILNWRRWDDLITMSGQPTEGQLAELTESGVTSVLNLGPHSNDGAHEDETATVAELGMDYIYIPVDFDAPTERDFDDFCAALKERRGQRLHVHCIYNARVSAFFFRYAREVSVSELEKAAEIMETIWRPGIVWSTFIGKASDLDKPIQYKGYDY